MFEEDITVGPESDYLSLVEALDKVKSGVHLLLKPIEFKFEENLIIKKSFAIQSDHEEILATIKAPNIIFDMTPDIFTVISHLRFDGHIIIKGGATINFEGCEFTSSIIEENSIVSVISSSPTFRMCKFYNFPKFAIEYLESRGGILTDSLFENIQVSGEPIFKGPGTKPHHEHNKTK